jgi:hypothetical protein
MPSVLRFPANQKDPDDLPDTADEFTPPPELLMEQPNPPRGTAAIRRSSATIVPEASFDEPTRPAEHPTPDLSDEFPWFETTAASPPPPSEDPVADPVDATVDPSADTAALPTPETSELSAPAPTNLPLLLAASAVMILLAGTSVMLVIAMLQKPEPAKTPPPVVSTMVAPDEALPAPAIGVPEPAEAGPAPAPVKHTKKKTASLEDIAPPPEVTVTTPAIEAPKEPEKPAAATPASDSDDKKKKGLFGKKKDR